MIAAQLPLLPEKRLGKQLEAVRDLTVFRHAGAWFTFREICDRIFWLWGISASEAGVSARLRDLRKMGYTVEKRVRSGNLWEYRVNP